MAADGRGGAAAVDDEIVALRLAGYRLADGRVEQFVVVARAQRRAQVGGVLLPQAHIERAGAGQPDPVAGFAEIVGERRDEAEAPAGLPHRPVARRAAGGVIALVQRPAFLQLRAHHRQREELVDPVGGADVGADLAQRHDLDEGEIEALRAGPFDEPVEFVLVHALERNRVDLDGETGGLGGGQPFQHLLELAPAGDGGEFFRVERIERNIDPAHAGAHQRFAVFGELAAVGRERQLVERALAEQFPEPFDQGHHPAAHQRLAAGQAQFAHAEAHEGAAQPLQLLDRQDLRLRQEGHVFGHAIDAAEIAPVGHRDAQIGYRPGERVDQRRGLMKRANVVRHRLTIAVGAAGGIPDCDVDRPPARGNSPTDAAQGFTIVEIDIRRLSRCNLEQFFVRRCI